MRVVPAGSVHVGLECICKAASGCNGTLLNGRHSVEPRCLFLQEAMPVDCGTLIINIVCNGDLDRVPPIRLNSWPGYLAVDHDDTPVDAVRSFEASFDNEVVIPCHGCTPFTLVRVRVICGPRSPWVSIRKRLSERELISKVPGQFV